MGHRLIFKMQRHNYELIIIIIHACLQTLLLVHFIFIAVDGVCIWFNRVVLDDLTLHEKSLVFVLTK